MSADAHKTEAITNAGAKQATAVAEDETNPSLQKFAAVDYNTGTIKLEFKEPVDWDTLDVSKLMLSSWYEVDDATTMTLTNVDVDANNDWGFGVGYTHPQVPHEITSVLIITMTPADLDKLKGEETFCKNSNGNDCYVAIKPGFIKDVSGNAIDEAELDPNRKAESVSLDTSGPTLKKAGLSMQAGTLELSFDEPVVATSIQLQELKFISNADPNTDGIKSLKMSAFGATDLLETNVEDRSNKNKFTITLPPLQLNKLKAADGLCTKTSDCFVLLEAAFIKDIASGANANREMTAGQGLSSFARDTTAPAFTQFTSYDPNTGMFSIKFNEAIDKDSVVWGGITFQATAAEPASTTLKRRLLNEGSSVYVDDSTKLEIQLTMHAKDLEAIQLMTTNLLSEKANSFVAFAADAIADMGGAKMEAVTTGKPAQSITPRNPAKLDSFKLNMATEELELTFDSAMKADSYKPHQVTIRSGQGEGTEGVDFVTLTDKSSTTDSSDGIVIVIKLGQADVDKITAARGLATKGPGDGVGNTFLSLTATAFTNIFSDTIAAVVPANALSVAATDGYTTDSVPPKLTNFELKLDPGSITLSFDEVVDLNTFTAKDQLTLQSENTKEGAIVISGGKAEELTDETDSARSFTFPLEPADLNAIKANGELGTSKANTNLVMTAGAIKDMAGVNVDKIEDPGKPAFAVTGDQSGPELVSFTLDMDLGTILMTFSETTLPESRIPKKLTLQTDTDATPADFYDLKLGEAAAVNSTIIKFTIDPGDLNEIKAKRGLAKDAGSTVLTVKEGLLRMPATTV
jgi:hypothetical protein